jgi:hypothetical protein
MLSKCANPSCPILFRNLMKGRLFQVEASSDPTQHRANGHSPKKPSRRVEHYWLCDSCAGSVTIVFRRNRELAVVPKRQALADVPLAALSLRKPPVKHIGPSSTMAEFNSRHRRIL